MSHPDGVSGPISKQHYVRENGLGNCIILNILDYILSTFLVLLKALGRGGIGKGEGM